ncbi:MAG: hypothetical protein ACRDYA_09345 [Egibacteraceae bacterium]
MRYRDRSPGTVAALLPLLHRIADASQGTEQELGHAGRLARALATIRPAAAETGSAALPRRRSAAAISPSPPAAAAGDLLNLVMAGSRLDEALTDADERVVPWNARETTLDTGLFAASELGRWKEALALDAGVADSKLRRGAPGAGGHTVRRPCAGRC